MHQVSGPSTAHQRCRVHKFVDVLLLCPLRRSRPPLHDSKTMESEVERSWVVVGHTFLYDGVGRETTMEHLAQRLPVPATKVIASRPSLPSQSFKASRQNPINESGSIPNATSQRLSLGSSATIYGLDGDDK